MVGVPRKREVSQNKVSGLSSSKKRGAPFKGEVRDCENERFIKDKRSLFRSFKCFYAKGIYLNPELNI